MSAPSGVFTYFFFSCATTEDNYTGYRMNEFQDIYMNSTISRPTSFQYVFITVENCSGIWIRGTFTLSLYADLQINDVFHFIQMDCFEVDNKPF